MVIMYPGFPTSLLRKIRCPRDGGGLILREPVNPADGLIVGGRVSCDECRFEYRISGGILDLLAGRGDIDETMQREIEARNMDAGSYDQFTRQKWYRLEIPSTLEHLEDIDGKKVVEFGSGTGRFSIEIAKRASSLLAIDFSLASHRVHERLISEDGRVGLVLADVCTTRLEPETFDIAVSMQLLEHIPSERQRADFLRIVHECLKPGSSLICTAYHMDMARRILRRPKEGHHNSGIFFHYFHNDELKEMFSEHFRIVEIYPILSHFPIIWRLQFKFPWLIGFLERTPFFREFCGLTLIKAVK